MGARIRFAREEDAPQILAIYRPYVEKTAVTFETAVPDVAAFAARVREIAARFPYLLLEADGGLVGYAYAHRQAERAAFDWNAELSIYLAEGATGRGFGKPLYALLMRLLEMQGYVNFYAIITGSNVGSVAFHERMGFVRCGLHEKTGYKFGAWHDTVWLCRRAREGAPGALCGVHELDAAAVAREIARSEAEIGARLCATARR